MRPGLEPSRSFARPEPHRGRISLRCAAVLTAINMFEYILKGRNNLMFHSESLPAVWASGKDFHLDLYRKIQGGWWHMSECTTFMGAFRTIKHLMDEDPVLIAAIYKKKVIGQGEYYKRGTAGRLERVETVRSEDAMVGVVERAFREYEEDALSLEELTQEFECDWPGCGRTVNSGAIARVL